jgi:protein SCO1/2
VITEPTVVYFGYTFCPDVCPLDAARNAAAVDILAEQGISVTPVFITIDPARDTQDVVGEYTDNFHPKMIGLTGSDEQIAAVSRAYKTYYSKADDDPDYYLMQHSTFTYLVLPETGFVEFFRQPTPAEEVAEVTACFVTQA